LRVSAGLTASPDTNDSLHSGGLLSRRPDACRKLPLVALGR
jgi:hypothetical protein